MDNELILICALTGVINLIGALAYAARIAGVRTARIALSFALFNVLLLVSRTSNRFLGPFLAKRIETALAAGRGEALIWISGWCSSPRPPRWRWGSCWCRPGSGSLLRRSRSSRPTARPRG